MTLVNSHIVVDFTEGYQWRQIQGSYSQGRLNVGVMIAWEVLIMYYMYLFLMYIVLI
jgi:ABC-type multidrug transport system permease subunit